MHGCQFSQPSNQSSPEDNERQMQDLSDLSRENEMLRLDLDEMEDQNQQLQHDLDQSCKMLAVKKNKLKYLKLNYKRDVREYNLKLYDQVDAYMQLYELAMGYIRQEPKMHKLLSDHPSYYRLLKAGGLK